MQRFSYLNSKNVTIMIKCDLILEKLETAFQNQNETQDQRHH